MKLMVKKLDKPLDNTLFNNLDPSSAAKLLARHLPNPDHMSLEPFGSGDFCLAFRLDNQIVRVARHIEAAAALRRESCILKKIAPALPVAVPHLSFHAPRGCPPFTIHDEIVGEVLTRELWESQSAGMQVNLASDLATFLSTLHSLPVELGLGCGLLQLDATQFAQTLREEITNTVHGLLETETQNRLEITLERWCLPSVHHQRQALLHGDIGPGHLFYNPRSGHLTGVIDFGDITIGEPARDFIYVYEDFGPALLGEVLQRYTGKNAPEMMPEIRKWYLLEAISWTIARHREKREADVVHGLAEIRRELAVGFE
jgi:aminoglycoside 2''-phosphotransferase